MKRTNHLERFFTAISETIMGAEKSFLDLLSAIAPYLTPIPVSWLTFFHTRDLLGFPAWVAATSALAVEILGMASISTAVRFWRNNARYKSEHEKAPLLMVIGVYAFYLVIILATNTLLEVIADKRSPAAILAIGLFSLLSVPSGILVAVRSQYAAMLEERRERQEERRQERQARTAPPQLTYAQDTQEVKPQAKNFPRKP